MFIALTEEMEDEDEVMTTRQIAVNIRNIAWFQVSDEDSDKTFVEMIVGDSIVVSESFNEIWCRIKEINR